MFKMSLVSISEAMFPFAESPLNWLRTERQRKERKNGNIREYAIVHKLACSNWILWLCHVPSKLPQQPESLLTKCINLRYVDGHHVKCAPLASTPVMAFKINRLDGLLRWEYNSMQKKMLFGHNSVKFEERTKTPAAPIGIHWRTDSWSVRSNYTEHSVWANDYQYIDHFAWVQRQVIGGQFCWTIR